MRTEYWSSFTIHEILPDQFIRKIQEHPHDVEDDGGTGWREPDVYTKPRTFYKRASLRATGRKSWETAFAAV